MDLEVRGAHSGLRRAENALQRGRDIRAGDIVGNKGGGTRFTQAYFDRIRSLERQVDTAKQRLDLAYEARNSLK